MYLIKGRQRLCVRKYQFREEIAVYMTAKTALQKKVYKGKELHGDGEEWVTVR